MESTVEFFHADAAQPFCIVEVGFQPSDGDLVNIKKETWLVIGRSFSVDYAGTQHQTMRCNVIVQPHKPHE